MTTEIVAPVRKGPRPKTNDERFLPRLRVEGACVVFEGSRVFYRAKSGRAYGGYGVFGVRTPGAKGHRPTLAHRYAWERLHGPIPSGLRVLHHCDNPPCVKTDGDEQWPDGHLFLGTSADNGKDMAAKGRSGRTTQPEAWANATGENHWTHVHPERVARGSKHARSSAKITVADVLEIRRSNVRPYRLLGIRYGLTANSIYRIKAGQLWDFPDAFPPEKPDVED